MLCIGSRAGADVRSESERSADTQPLLQQRPTPIFPTRHDRMTEKQKKLAWAAVVVALATGISRVVGVAREILTANAFGVSVQLNTFASVAVIPNLIRQLVADAAVSAAFVPVFTGLFAKGERERAYKLASSLLSFMVVVVGTVTLVLMLGAPLLVKIFFPQFAGQPYISHLAVDMLRILLPTVLLFSVSGVVIGVLYSYERFTMPAVVSIVWNLVIIAFIVFFSAPGRLGIYALVWGTFFGTVAQLLLLIPSLRRVDLKWRVSFAWRDPLLRRVLLLMVPVTITLGILNFNALIDFFFAQFVSDHAAAQINYAFRLYQLPQGMFAITIGTVLFPTLSRYAADNDMESFRETLSMGVRQIFFVSLPFVAWFVVVPHSMVQLIIHGQFVPADTAAVAPILAFFTLGMAFANVNVMFNRGFQSMQRPWLPLYVGIVNLVLNALLDWVLYKPLGARGIVLSTSIVSAFNFVALLVLMRRQIDSVDGRRILVGLGKILTCSAALAAVSWARGNGCAPLPKRTRAADPRGGRCVRRRRPRLPGGGQAAAGRGTVGGQPADAARAQTRSAAGRDRAGAVSGVERRWRGYRREQAAQQDARGLAWGDVLVDFEGWQVPHLVFAEVESHALLDVHNGADWNGNPLFAPQVSLAEQDVRHLVAVGIDDQPPDPADRSVGGMDVLAAAHLHLV